MPAYFDSGFSVRQPMWHGLGTVLDDYPEDWNAARKVAGLDWEPATAPVYVRKPSPDWDEATFGPPTDDNPLAWVHERIDGHQLVQRDDNAAVLGMVSDGYRLIGHDVMGEIVEALTEQPNVRFETAGSVRGGAQVWALAYLDEPYQAGGSDDTDTYPYIALLNSHDGTGACKVVATDIRVVCWNTYSAASAQGERTGRQFVFRHTAGVMDRIEEAKTALSTVREESQAWRVLAQELAGTPVNDQALGWFIDGFIPDPEGEVTERVRNERAARRSTFRKLYEESPTTEGHRGTALGVVDAAVEYLDHLRTFRNPDTYLARTLLRPEPIKGRAIQLVQECVLASV